MDQFLFFKELWSVFNSHYVLICLPLFSLFQNFELETDTTSSKGQQEKDSILDSGLDSPGNADDKDSNRPASWEWLSGLRCSFFILFIALRGNFLFPLVTCIAFLPVIENIIFVPVSPASLRLQDLTAVDT